MLEITMTLVEKFRVWAAGRQPVMSVAGVLSERAPAMSVAAPLSIRRSLSSSRLCWFAYMTTVLVCLAIFSCPVAFGEDSSDVKTIIERSVQANNADWRQAPEYDFYETDVDDGGTKTYQVMMILGSPYQRLVKVDDKSLPPEDEQKEQHALEAAIASRQKESPRQRAQRMAKYQKERARDHALMDQLTVAFNFQLEGTEKMGPYEVYALRATPKPGYQPPNYQTKVLTGMEGRLWIDTKTFQWVKVEATVVHPVSIEGFLARVQPGTRFILENMPVSENLWLPKHFEMKSSAKVLLLFTHREQENDTYFNYRKVQPEPLLSTTGQ